MGVLIRQINKEDIESVLQLFNCLNKTDRKFLALDKKLSLIKQNIKQEKHTFVAEYDGRIVGFARESGRPGGFVMLEEIVTDPEMRGQGVGSVLLKYLLALYPKMLAKTFASNQNINKLLEKHGFTVKETSPKGEILNWIHQ